MESQLNRIASFLTWNHRVSASVLSSRGFYYGGSGDLVICHRCRLQFGNWRTLEDLEELHRVGPGSCIEGGCRGTTGIARDRQDAAATARRPAAAVMTAGSSNRDNTEDSDEQARLRHSLSSASTHLTSSDLPYQTETVRHFNRPRGDDFSKNVEPAFGTVRGASNEIGDVSTASTQPDSSLFQSMVAVAGVQHEDEDNLTLDLLEDEITPMYCTEMSGDMEQASSSSAECTDNDLP